MDEFWPVDALLQFNEEEGLAQLSHLPEVKVREVLSRLSEATGDHASDRRTEIPVALFQELRKWLPPGTGRTWVLLGLRPKRAQCEELSVFEVLGNITSRYLGAANDPSLPKNRTWTQRHGWRVDPLRLVVSERIEEVFGKKLSRALDAVGARLWGDFGIDLPRVVQATSPTMSLDTYAWWMRDNCLGSGEVLLGMELVQAPQKFLSKVQGLDTIHPANQLPAKWVDPEVRRRKLPDRFPVFSPQQVIASHLWQLCSSFPENLLSHRSLNNRLKDLNQSSLLAEMERAGLRTSHLLEVLKLLLREGVPVRDIGGLVVALLSRFSKTETPEEQAERVRPTLLPSLIGARGQQTLTVLRPEPEVLQTAAEKDLLKTASALEALLDPYDKPPAALLSPPEFRPHLGAAIRRTRFKKVWVLKPSEIPDWVEVDEF